MSELQQLLQNAIPCARGTLKDNYSNLLKVADYCESNYEEAKDKRKALEETMAFATQSLASVAYQISNLASDILKTMDLQLAEVRQVEAKVCSIAQVRRRQHEEVQWEVFICPGTCFSGCSVQEGGVEGNAFLSSFPAGCSLIKRKRRIVLSAAASHRDRSQPQGPETDEAKICRALGSHTGVCFPSSVLSAAGAAATAGALRHFGCVPLLARRFGSVTEGPPKAHDPVSRKGALPWKGGFQAWPFDAKSGRLERKSPPFLKKQDHGTQLAKTGTLCRRGNVTSSGQSSGSLRRSQRIPEPIRPPVVPDGKPSSSGYSPTEAMEKTGMIAPAEPPPPPPPTLSPFPPPAEASDVLPPPLPEDLLPPPPPFAVSDVTPDLDFPMTPPPLDASTLEQLVPPLLPPPPPPEKLPWAPDTYLEKVVTLYPYTQQQEQELSFAEGNVIYVTRRYSDGWCEGVTSDAKGLFPGNYVEPLP
nr:ABI gene family member 3 [Zootoca vivipara]